MLVLVILFKQSHSTGFPSFSFSATVATTKDTWWMNLTTSHLSAEEQYDSADSAKCASGASGISVVGRSLMGLLASFAVMCLLK